MRGRGVGELSIGGEREGIGGGGGELAAGFNIGGALEITVGGTGVIGGGTLTAGSIDRTGGSVDVGSGAAKEAALAGGGVSDFWNCCRSRDISSSSERIFDCSNSFAAENELILMKTQTGKITRTSRAKVTSRTTKSMR